MKKYRRLLLFLLLIFFAVPSFADDGAAPPEPSKDPEKLDDIVVEAEGSHRDMVLKPEGTVISTSDHDLIGGSASVLDYLKALPIIDFNGITDLTPDEDTISMRDFSSDRFVTAIDGLTVQKTGGRKGSNIVDYALMPAFLIDKVEILPGPHSALYDAKAIGGVVNIITKAPKMHDTLKPDITLNTSYSSYNTLNTNLSAQGSLSRFTYDLGYQKNSTDGYLRQSETDIQTFFTRLGVILPLEGCVTVSGSYSTADRQIPVNNNPDVSDTNGATGYKSDYPETEGSLFDPWQKPTWDKKAWAYRLNYFQNLPIGKLSFGAYTSREDRDRAYRDWVNASNHALGIQYTSGVTTWRQHGGKIMDEFTWSGNHVTTLGFDMARLYDGTGWEGDERVDKRGTFLQHRWGIIPSLNLKLGLRYEDLQIHVSNNPASQIPDKGNWIVRHWREINPKSFLTWDMDGIGTAFRDTSLSAGVSRIWHAPDAHGDYNPQGRPTGAWLDPEHGIGYDLIFMRRLFGDVNFKVDYSYYDIKDYLMHNSTYAQYSGASAGNLRYSDYMINLDGVHRHGVETELDGHITRDLSFYLTYAWQKFENQGDEPAGRDGLDNMAEHRVTAGLRYAVLERTTLMLDYTFQSDEVIENSDEIEDPNTHEVIGYSWSEVKNPSHSVFDLGVKQNLYKSDGLLRDATLTVYVKNLFDEDYVNTSGYPATDRTFGASLSFSM
jgi:iron complex outermembrane receptor protein